MNSSKKYLLFFLLFLLIVVTTTCRDKQPELNGEVFVVTEGAGNYKLGLVEIVAIPEDSVAPYVISELKKREESRQERIISTSKEGNFDPRHKLYTDFFNSVEDDLFLANFFAGLPHGVAKSQTDADGKFTIKLPNPGKYRFAAQAERKVGTEKTEHYYWLVQVDTDKQTQKLMLSNDNLMH